MIKFSKIASILSLCLLISGLVLSLPLSLNAASLDNPLGDNNLAPQQLYGRIIYAFMGVTGTVALLMFVIGGFQWMTAAGNSEKVKKGRDTLMWAVFGLVVIFSSYAILRTILETLRF